MTPPSAQLSQQELQDHTYRSLGRFFIAVARVELNLALRVGGAGAFRDKLERFLETSIVQDDDNEHFYEISAWYMLADWMRETRNQFAHGRWGFHTHTQKIVHVSGYPPAQQTERRYSLIQLDSIVNDIEMIDKELAKIA